MDQPARSQIQLAQSPAAELARFTPSFFPKWLLRLMFNTLALQLEMHLELDLSPNNQEFPRTCAAKLQKLFGKLSRNFRHDLAGLVHCQG